MTNIMFLISMLLYFATTTFAVSAGGPTVNSNNGDLVVNINTVGGNMYVSRLLTTNPNATQPRSVPSAVVTTAELEALNATVVGVLQSLQSLQTALQQETSRAMAAESALGLLLNTINATNVQQGMTILSTLTASEASLSTVINAEVVRSVSADGSLAQSASTAMVSEQTRATTAEASLGTWTNVEASRAVGIDSSLNVSVQNERSRALGVEGAISAAVITEQTRATTAEASLGTWTNMEASRAVNIDSSLGVSVQNERSRAMLIENAVSTAVITEQTRATTAEASLGTWTNVEASRAVGVESSLNISVQNERTRALAIESAISTAVVTEQTRAISAESSLLASSVTTERSRAMAVESSLASVLQLGSLLNPAWSCLDLQTRNPVPTGIYWIRPSPSFNAFQALCDMDTDGGGWTMVFKLMSNSNLNPYNFWTSTSPLNDNTPAPLTFTATPGYNYINRYVTNLWNANGVTINTARVHVMNGGVMQKFVKFNAAGSNSQSWFASGSVLSTSWTDFSLGFNYFSIAGDNSVNARYFQINKVYGGCPGDQGWMVASFGTSCTWETQYNAKPAIIYSTGSTYVTWQSGGIALADSLIVMIR